jgi:hypothetical protein
MTAATRSSPPSSLQALDTSRYVTATAIGGGGGQAFASGLAGTATRDARDTTAAQSPPPSSTSVSSGLRVPKPNARLDRSTTVTAPPTGSYS